ncbi:MAG: hypothetical protein P4L51_09245 [Puia sp.]|nr:hypothetical protein [Puia sp.]
MSEPVIPVAEVPAAVILLAAILLAAISGRAISGTVISGSVILGAAIPRYLLSDHRAAVFGRLFSDGYFSGDSFLSLVRFLIKTPFGESRTKATFVLGDRRFRQPLMQAALDAGQPFIQATIYSGKPLFRQTFI